MTAANALAYFAQVAVIVAACAGLPALLRLRAPSLQHAFWRALLLVSLLSPLLQPRQATGDASALAQRPVVSAAGMLVSQSVPGTPSPAPVHVDWARLAIVVFAGGVAFRFAWLGVGMARLRRLRRLATEPAAGFEDLQQVIGVEVPIWWSREAPHPVTFGALRPVVLLPYALQDADVAAQRAVVAHELHHVRRHDWLWTISEECVRSAFWFHPAIWWLISRVQLARETVVDELSILTTNARRVYLDTLLAFADEGGPQSSTAFSARRHLFHRIMLLSREGTMSPIRIALVSCLLVVALGAGSLGAVRAFPLTRPAAADGTVSVDFDDADLASVLSLFSQISGRPVRVDPAVRARVTVHLKNVTWEDALTQILRPIGMRYRLVADAVQVEPAAAASRDVEPQSAQGTPVVQPLVPETRETYHAVATHYLQIVQKDASLTPAEKLADIAKGIAAEDRSLAIDPNYLPALVYKNILLRLQAGLTTDPSQRERLIAEADELRQTAIVLRGNSAPRQSFEVVPDGAVPPPPPQPPSSSSNDVMVFVPKESAAIDNPVRIGQSVPPPAKVRDVKPVYPPLARQAGVQGVVVVEVLIDAAGNVAQAHILRSIPLLDQAALDAVRQWRFTPTTVEGAPHAALMTVTVNFTAQ